MSYRHLTREQRYTISLLKTQGASPANIAQTLGYHRSTIDRELKRNATPTGSYSFTKAHRQARIRASQASCRQTRIAPESLDFIYEKLVTQQWSPEQISHQLKEQGLPAVSHESIYRLVYRDKAQGGELHIHLRHRVKSYKNRSLTNDKRGQLKNRVCIEKRPAIVEEKTRIGDWEMDLIVGKPGGAVLVTMVDRFSRKTLIAKADNKSANNVSQAILESFIDIRQRVHTLTYDNGKEFARHHVVDKILESQSYFAHPYSSWERGLNENTNGLIRQYFPKKSSFDELTPKQILEVQNKLNSRPRKCLDWKTPNDIFYIN